MFADCLFTPAYAPRHPRESQTMARTATSAVSTIRGVEDLSNSRYYSVNRRLLSVLGQWPYQNANAKRVLGFVTTVGFICFYYTQIAALIVYYDDPAQVLEILPQFIAGITAGVKVFTLMICSMKVKQLSDRIISDWQTYDSEEETDILKKYGEESRLITVLYAFCLGTTAVAFVQTPLIPQILNVLYPLNESRPRMYMYPSEYIFIDKDEHYTFFYVHSTTSVALIATAIVSSDTLFMMYVQHVCATFAITGHHFKSLSIKSRSRTRGRVKRNELFLRDVTHSVHCHEKAIELAKRTESLYSTPLLIHLALDAICLSVTLYQTSMLLAEKRIGMALRNISFIIGQLFHLFCASYPGQRLIDHSTDVKIQAVSGRWYEGPAHMQKMLMMVMRRSLEPCCLTAGKVFTFSLESFTAVVQNAMSFFMVLQSTK